MSKGAAKAAKAKARRAKAEAKKAVRVQPRPKPTRKRRRLLPPAERKFLELNVRNARRYVELVIRRKADAFRRSGRRFRSNSSQFTGPTTCLVPSRAGC